MSMTNRSNLDQLIFDSMTEGFIVRSPEGEVIRFNQAALNILGMSESELRKSPPWQWGWKVYDLDGVELRNEEYPSLKALKSKQPQTRIMKIEREDKPFFWLKIHAIPLENDFVLATFSDVTQQIEKNIELNLKKRDLFQTQSVARIGSWSFSLTSNESIWTAEMYNIFGFNENEAQPTTQQILNRIHPDDRSLCDTAIKRTLKDYTKAHQVKFRVLHSDRIFWVEAHSKCIAEFGKAREIHGICQDITDRVNLEAENGFIISSLNIGVWKWDIVHNVLDWDHRMYDVYGINKDDFSGAYDAWESSLVPEDKEKERAILNEALASKTMYATSFRIVTKTGDIRHIAARGVISRDENNKAAAIYGVNWDRTEEVKLQQEVEQERAKANQSARLASLGEMAGGVAHEINTPLAIIHSSAAILRRMVANKTLTDEILVSSLDEIAVTVKRISQIVSGLRNLSRDSSSEALSTFCMRDVMTDVLSICNEKFRIHSVEFKMDQDNSLFDLKIESRRVQLSQVFLNLFTNSYDAIGSLPEKWISLELSKVGESIQFLVKDSGRGIPDGTKEKIFNPFFTTKEVGKGTGLGLSLSKTLIESNRGQLYLDEKSANTCFVIDLPLKAS